MDFLFKRKQYLILKNVQYKIISLVVMSGFTATILFMGLLMLAIERMIGRVQESSLLTRSQMMTIFLTWDELIICFFALSVVFIALFAFYGLYVSNKIAGPVYSMMNSLQAYIDGNKHVRTAIRRADFFQDLSLKINAALDAKQTTKPD